ncbi:hypothetical protein [Dactylosporangium sp. CA-139066]|uniref:hypothetical protein n=1 Tax=Dactylosporangium sp. CA-139066 TaxID=3239930 RepID=UPI003D8BAC6B
MTMSRTRRWLAPAAAAALVIALLTTGVALHRQAAHTGPTPQAANRTQPAGTPASSPPTDSAGPSAAAPVADPRRFLTGWADRLQAASTDGQHGAYEYIAARSAERDGELTPTGPAGPLVHRLLTTWTKPSHGRAMLHMLAGAEPACPALSDQTWDEPGRWDGALGTDPAAELHRLASTGTALATRTNPYGIDLFGQIGEEAINRILSRTARAALLRMLADQPDIEVRNAVQDPLGRPGIAASTVLLTPLGPNLLRRTLIFDPDTGELLATQRQFQTTTGVSGGPASDPTAAPDEGLLFLARAYTADTHTPEPPCTAPAPPASAA